MTVKSRVGRDVIITQTGTKLNNIGKLTIRTDGTIASELFQRYRPWVPQGNMWIQKNDSLSRLAKRELGSYDRWI